MRHKSLWHVGEIFKFVGIFSAILGILGMIISIVLAASIASALAEYPIFQFLIGYLGGSIGLLLSCFFCFTMVWAGVIYYWWGGLTHVLINIEQNTRSIEVKTVVIQKREIKRDPLEDHRRFMPPKK